jgi:Tfp pilus assembly protein FimT
MRFSEGFTILETVLVIGILALIFLIGIPFTFNFYIDYELVKERDNLISIYQQARNATMTGEGGSAHGVYLTGDGYVLFEGASYASRSTERDLDISKSDLINITGSTEVVFETLSGRVASTSFSITNGKKTFNIDINTEGRIDWEL